MECHHPYLVGSALPSVAAGASGWAHEEGTPPHLVLTWSVLGCNGHMRRGPPPYLVLTWSVLGVTAASVSAASPRAASCEVAAPSVSANPATPGPPASGELGGRVPDWGGVCVRGPGDAALPASTSH